MTKSVTKRLHAYAENTLVAPLARLYRPALLGTRFIAVTGSCGKTQTKELIAAVLERRARTHRSFDSNNRYYSVARTILELRPWHRYCVLEMGASGPGSLERAVDLLRPHLAVVTSIGEDHYKAFRGADAAAAEKQRLVSALAEGGIAILNRDDSRVLAMADHCRGRVLTYGLTQDADVQGSVVAWKWPDPLCLQVRHESETALVRTQLHGAHQATGILAALATGVACGIELQDAAQALAPATPVFGRMSVEEVCEEVTFVHDEFKAPLWTMDAVVSYLGAARAKRTILVVGTLSDYSGSASTRYCRLAKSALENVDQVVFASRYAPSHLRKLQAAFADRLHVFNGTRDAAEFLRGFLAPGDLVLLKGSIRADHLERIPMHCQSGIRCWRSSCGREIFCHQCDLRKVPSTDTATESEGRAAISADRDV